MKVTIEVSDDVVNSIIASGLHIVRYWGQIAYQDDGTCVIEVPDAHDNEPRRYDWPTSDPGRAQLIGIGLAIMAEKHPKWFATLLKGDYDANTCDVLIQCMLFGEVRYG